jgi:uncharacterized membrane protein
MLWQKFLVEWPLQFLRLLWANRHTPLPALLRKITWQKVVFFAVLLVAAYTFAQVFSLDLAFFMAGDVAIYCEIASAVMFVVVRGHIRQSVHTAKLSLTYAMRRARIWCRRGMSARRRRIIKGPTTSGKGADDDGGWLPELRGLALQS